MIPQGGATVARVVHTHDVGRSIRSPATNYDTRGKDTFRTSYINYTKGGNN